VPRRAPLALALALAVSHAACGDNARLALDAALDAAIDTPPGVPDLTLIGAQMDGTVGTIEMAFAPDACEVIERCVGAPGPRRLLVFDAVTANIGTADIVIGPPPPAGVSDDRFAWSPCHLHHHVIGYAVYELRDASGAVVGGRKQAFCLQDTQQLRAGWPSHGYFCSNQGLSAGWADVYSRNLPCQWIDVTDVAPGMYTLAVRVNPTGGFPDSDPTNNEWTHAGVVVSSAHFRTPAER
jgi:Lysyl oxidase